MTAHSQSPFWQQTALDSGSVYQIATNAQGDIFASVGPSVGHSSYRFYRSTDDGDSWQTLDFGFPDPVGSFWFVPTRDSSREDIYAVFDTGPIDTTNSGVYYSSDNGDTWQRRLSIRGFCGLMTPDSGRTFLAGVCLSGRGGVYRSLDSCRTWTELTPDYCGGPGAKCPGNICGNPSVGRPVITRQGTILAGHELLQCGEPYGIHRSSDNGQTWTRHRTWSPSGAGGRGFLIPSEGPIFMTAADGVNRSVNDGLSWNSANSGIPSSNWDITAIAMDSNRTMYVGENDWGPPVGGVYRSTDNGQSWAQWSDGLVSRGVWSLRVNANGYIFAGQVQFGVFRSIRPWGALFASNRSEIMFPKVPAGTSVTDSFTVYNRHAQIALHSMSVTATDVAFTVSPDTIIIPPGDSASISVTFSPDSVRSYAGAIILEHTGRSSPDSIQVQGDAVMGIGDENRLPKEFALAQNYPNPFNPSTTFTFDVPYSSFIILTVYDLLGQEVATLVNEKKQPGSYSVAWNASTMSSGVYFYRLSALPTARRDIVVKDGQAGEFISIRKLLLIR